MANNNVHLLPRRKLKKRFSIKTFLPAIVADVEDAIDFVTSEFSDDFERGLRYYNGEVDIESIPGRSRAVSTQVRDSIRNLKPSILRVLCGGKKIVKYEPSNIQVAPVVEQQEAYIHQLFWRSGGYKLMYDGLDESLKFKLCPLKVYWDDTPTPEYNRITMVTMDELQFISEMPDVTVLSTEENAASPIGGVELYDMEVVQTPQNGKIVMEAIPCHEFFISRNATTTKDARVHGQKRSVTVAEAIEMGIEYDNWEDLDDDDPEQNETPELSATRRGYRKDAEEDRGDILSHRFALTEAYVYLDLEGEDYQQLYCVYLGGSNYEYLGHERETESPFEVMAHDPRPFTVYGESIPDIQMETQDVMTSLLRSTIDNAHAANHPRIGGNPQQVNFDDLMNHDIGYPFRMKAGAQVQVVAIPSTLQGSLPLIQWLEQDSQNKLGITKAAQGLDPDALQSTDKDAVRNTIMLAQGQVELMARNIVETGIIPVFRKLLKLSVQHLDRIQIVKIKGTLLPVDQLLFDPSCYAKPMVGLGAQETEMMLAGLQATLANQIQIIQMMGIDNPFVTASHVYNTLEDLTEQFGLSNVGRYYNLVTPEVEAAFAQKRAQQAAEAAKAGAKEGGMDPVMGLLESEKIKAGTEKLKLIASQRSDTLQMQWKAIELNAKDDLERDKLAQNREIESAVVLGKTMVAVDQNAIKREQAAPRTGAAEGGSAEPAGEAAPSASPIGGVE